jgi:polyhydroxybutyrate depolymerase
MTQQFRMQNRLCARSSATWLALVAGIACGTEDSGANGPGGAGQGTESPAPPVKMNEVEMGAGGPAAPPPDSTDGIAPVADGSEAVTTPSLTPVMAGTAGMGDMTEVGDTSEPGDSNGSASAAPGPCSPARPHAVGTSTVNLQSGGSDRSYLLHIPPDYDGSKRLPLVFDVHGYSSFASEQLMRSKWDRMADQEGFVLINPDGVDRSWNAGSCCGGNEQDDVTFFRDMVTKATAELCIDSKRVYVSGHSNGGAMTYRLACEAADIFAAVAPVCGWMTVSSCNPARPIPVLAMRALDDGIVRIDSADGDIDEWLSNDECADDQVTTSGVCKTYESCSGGTQVMDCRPRGNHDFFYGSNPDNYLVPDNAWPFFKQFSLP